MFIALLAPDFAKKGRTLDQGHVAFHHDKVDPWSNLGNNVKLVQAPHQVRSSFMTHSIKCKCGLPCHQGKHPRVPFISSIIWARRRIAHSAVAV